MSFDAEVEEILGEVETHWRAHPLYMPDVELEAWRVERRLRRAFDGVVVEQEPVDERRRRLTSRHMGDGQILALTDYLIEDVLPAVGVGLLAGQSRVGKSHILLHLAGALATGQEFLGRQIDARVGSLILAAEAAGSLDVRMLALRDHKLKAPSEPLPIMWMDIEGMALADIREVIALAEKDMLDIYGVPLGMVAVDTLSAAFPMPPSGGNEADHASRTMTTLKSLRPDGLIMGVMHFGKDVTRGVLGTVGWTARADFIIAATAKVLEEDTGRVEGRALAVTKMKSGKTGMVSGFELREVVVATNAKGKPVTSVVLDACALPGGRKPGKHEALLRECFAEAVAKSDPLGDAPFGLAAKDDVRRLFKAGSPAVGRNAFSAAVKALGFKTEFVNGVEYLRPRPRREGEGRGDF